jgi:hypothetical protein
VRNTDKVSEKRERGITKKVKGPSRELRGRIKATGVIRIRR